jgi:hypothetical protein
MPSRAAGIAVDVQHRLQALVLLIAADVVQLRPPAHLLDEDRRPVAQRFRIGGLEAVLELRAGDAVLDRQILYRLEVELDARHGLQRRRQSADDGCRRRRALGQRLQVDEQAAAVERRVSCRRCR